MPIPLSLVLASPRQRSWGHSIEQSLSNFQCPGCLSACVLHTWSRDHHAGRVLLCAAFGIIYDHAHWFTTATTS